MQPTFSQSNFHFITGPCSSNVYSEMMEAFGCEVQVITAVLLTFQPQASSGRAPWQDNEVTVSRNTTHDMGLLSCGIADLKHVSLSWHGHCTHGSSCVGWG